MFGSRWGVLAVAPVLVLSGAGAVGACSTLCTKYTVQLANGVRGGASAMAMLMVWLGVSAGAIAWGAVASRVGLRSVLLIAAACNVVVTAGRATRPATPNRALDARQQNRMRRVRRFTVIDRTSV